MSYKNVLRGKLAKSNGAFFEHQIDCTCEWYKMQYLAYIEKTPEPMRPLKPLEKGKFVACFEKAAQPDYKGTLQGGKAICFEAKFSNRPIIEKKRVTDEQMGALALHHRLGAETFILVCFGDDIVPEYFRIPFEVWRDMKKIYGRVHLKKEELGSYRLQTTSMNYIQFLT